MTIFSSLAILLLLNSSAQNILVNDACLYIHIMLKDLIRFSAVGPLTIFLLRKISLYRLRELRYNIYV